MIDARCALKLLMQFGQIASVAAVSITARRVGRACQSTARYHVAVFVSPRRAVLYVVYLRHGDMVEVYHVAAYMRQCRFLAEQISGTWETVLQRYGLDGKTAVLINHLLTRRVDSMKLYLIVEVVAESGEERVKNGAKFLRSIDGKWHGTSEQSEGREHADKSEAMVAMDMTDEYRHHLVESHS